ncbi:hypothetical protein RvY_10113-2 [Ramazzottius varieornatus]|uniref:Uncharacterized protein n=1 Tax=Ramazzottius varieornatus TaxID=947166 RepID=A0A1D1VBN8_RAMVA|nr:hypothetical protein RvY_10113-2 [Ramazzottius varieornatus]
MENPRIKPERCPDIDEVLGEVRDPKLERLAGLDSKKDPDDTEFRYGGHNAYEYVREFGVDEYMNFDQFTRRLVVLSFCINFFRGVVSLLLQNVAIGKDEVR